MYADAAQMLEGERVKQEQIDKAKAGTEYSFTKLNTSLDRITCAKKIDVGP